MAADARENGLPEEQSNDQTHKSADNTEPNGHQDTAAKDHAGRIGSLCDIVDGRRPNPEVDEHQKRRGQQCRKRVNALAARSQEAGDQYRCRHRKNEVQDASGERHRRLL